MMATPAPSAHARVAAGFARPAYLSALVLVQPLVALGYVGGGRWTGGLAAYYDWTYALAHLALVAAALLVREGVADRRWGLALLGALAALGWVAAWYGLELAPLAGQVEALPAECRRLMSL